MNGASGRVVPLLASASAMAVVWLALFATTSLAQDMDCAAPQTQVELTACAGIDFETADRALNDLWPKLVAAAKANDAYVAEQASLTGVPTTLEALRTAQRAWIGFRDAQCDYEAYAVFGGTAQPMIGSLCLARLTNERIDQLVEAMEGMQ